MNRDVDQQRPDLGFNWWNVNVTAGRDGYPKIWISTSRLEDFSLLAVDFLLLVINGNRRVLPVPNVECNFKST